MKAHLTFRATLPGREGGGGARSYDQDGAACCARERRYGGRRQGDREPETGVGGVWAK